jgi:formate/nitrite transporter FocA (FNT family)
LTEQHEKRSVAKAAKLPSKLIYEVIRREGEEELQRPLHSLAWSGIAAGVLISFSLLGEAILRTHLPDNPARFLLENVGYSFGFLLVVLGRMQLFTENTITTVLPVAADPTRRNFTALARLWSIVLVANVVGALLIALMLAWTPAFPAALSPAMTELALHGTGFGAVDGFARAIPAGMLVAAIVWMMPQSNGNSFWVILTFTWLIAAGDFAHIVVGSVEMWYLIAGDSWAQARRCSASSCRCWRAISSAAPSSSRCWRGRR